jgi:hypothetical protein
LAPPEPDNEGPFETISVGEDGDLAVYIAQMSLLDLRQAPIAGDAWMGRKKAWPRFRETTRLRTGESLQVNAWFWRSRLSR